MSAVRKLRAARQDLVDIVYHYIRQGSCPTARRFLKQAEATFERLATLPGLGTPYEPDEPLYAGLRYIPISHFRMYVFFFSVPLRMGLK